MQKDRVVGLGMIGKLYIAICDDHKVIADMTKDRVEKLLKELCVTQYGLDVYYSGTELVKWEKAYDLVLLDIDMPELSGFDVAERLSKLKKKPLIIFLTNYKDCAFQGHDYRPFGFLSKDCADERFNRLVSEAIKKIMTVETVILKDKGGKFKVIEVKEINRIKADAGDSYVYVKGEEYFDRRTLKIWESILPVGTFYRIEKSYLINLEHLAKFESRSVTLKNRITLPLGIRKKKGLIAAYHEFIRMKERR